MRFVLSNIYLFQIKMLKHSNSHSNIKNTSSMNNPDFTHSSLTGIRSSASVHTISSTSSSSSDSSVSVLSETTHVNTAKHVWDRYTNSSSQLPRNVRSSFSEAGSFGKPRSLPVSAKLDVNSASGSGHRITDGATTAAVLNTSGGGDEVTTGTADVRDDGGSVIVESKNVKILPQVRPQHDYRNNCSMPITKVASNPSWLKTMHDKFKEIRKLKLFGLRRIEFYILLGLMLMCLLM